MSLLVRAEMFVLFLPHHCTVTLWKGREGVKWELSFAFFRGWEMGFCALGLGFMKKKKTIEKWEWDFNLSNKGWDCGI